jgi:hypothetical protein
MSEIEKKSKTHEMSIDVVECRKVSGISDGGGNKDILNSERTSCCCGEIIQNQNTVVLFILILI